MWIKESYFVTSDLYFNMLFNLQSDKVNKIILSPIILELKKLYDSKKFTLDLLEELFSELTITQNRGLDKYMPSLRIKNSYLCLGLKLTTQLNGYNSYDNNSKISKEIFDEINRLQNKTSKHKVEISLKDISKYNLEEKTLELLKWVNEQMIFSFQILEKYSKKDLEENTISSILNNL